MSSEKKKANCSIDEAWHELFERTRFSLGMNMEAVRCVAATGKDECIEAMSISELYRKSTIHRDVLQRFAENNSPNPNLETICKLAYALNIPPAFLLMSGDDWRRLIRAIVYMQNTVQADKKLSDYVKTSIEKDKTTAGLKLIKMLKVYPEQQERPEEVGYQEWESKEQHLSQRNEITRQSVLAMTAIAQNFEAAVAGNDLTKSRREYLAILTTLAAIFGASV